MKLNAGDKVIVKNGLRVNAKYGGITFVSGMCQSIGKTFTIDGTHQSSMDDIVEFYTLEETGFNWSSEMLEKVVVPKDFVTVGCLLVCKNGDKIVVQVDNNGELVFKDHTGVNSMSGYNNDLTGKVWREEFNIAEVYGVSPLFNEFLSESKYHRKLLWEREKPKKTVTMDEIAKQFCVDVSCLTIKKED